MEQVELLPGGMMAAVAFAVAPSVQGQRVVVSVMRDGATTAFARSVVDINAGGADVVSDVLLAPGTYKLVIRAEPEPGAGHTPDLLHWVDAVPFVVAAAPPATTLPSTSLPPTVPPTAPPTLPPTVPSTVPSTAIPCSACPPGVAGLDCRLHCEEIEG